MVLNGWLTVEEETMELLNKDKMLRALDKASKEADRASTEAVCVSKKTRRGGRARKKGREGKKEDEEEAKTPSSHGSRWSLFVLRERFLSFLKVASQLCVLC
jgi:hypothetical protein